MGSDKAHELRKLGKAELTAKLTELRTELQTLRVAQVTGGAASKLAKIAVVRKKIARTLTVYHQSQKQRFREYYEDMKYVPLDLRPKKTRAIRRRLNPDQLAIKTDRQQKKLDNLPRRCYALKA
ncbi:ribosomal protein L35, isoform CRA_b [Ectocarpus siliculosus]|uniref:Ribosomal protein L35, isoform CRA_b n=1 Tax=Ectocarpus siliculosus TaxID=2880 RepID=D8LJI2_ECTSI|nr:ribosomal protein L35, isoform CRA_b [Ectocarpus siliculosus]|eukprot:CBN77009.1 ribosomal protein L35, isoform CRA_b [Ectocarpus siliculosus]